MNKEKTLFQTEFKDYQAARIAAWNEVACQEQTSCGQSVLYYNYGAGMPGTYYVSAYVRFHGTWAPYRLLFRSYSDTKCPYSKGSQSKVVRIRCSDVIFRGNNDYQVTFTDCCHCAGHF
jgi:hypothetical protein